MSRRRRKSKRSNSSPEHAGTEVAPESTVIALPPNSTGKWWVLLGLTIGAIGVGFAWFSGPSLRPSDVGPAEVSLPGGVSTDVGTMDSAEPLAMLTTASVKAEQEGFETQLDPGRDGWESEVVAELAKKRLVHLGERLAGHDLDEVLASEVSAEVTSGRLRPD